MFKFTASAPNSPFLIPKPEPIQTLDIELIILICEQLQFATYMALDRQLRTKEHLAYRKGLLSFGLTSKAFLEPALNVLWRTMSTVEPLLSVLPETSVVDCQKILVKQIGKKSWTRLRFYTSRVEKFDQRFLAETEESRIHYSVYARLGQMQPIFPALKEFHPAISISSSNSLMFFLSGTTSIASLPAMPAVKGSLDEGTDFGSSLALLAWKAPRLTSLHLHSQARYSGFTGSVACFSELQEVEVLRLSYYDSDFIRGLSSLKKLSYLKLTLPSKTLLDFTGIIDGFPSIKKLRVAGSPPELNKVLKLMPVSVLNDLRLSCDLDAVEEKRTGMLDLTKSLGRFSCLSTLEIVTVSEVDLNSPDSQFLWSLFAPLLRLKSLRQLSYDVPLFLTDQKTAEMAEAWPDMENLALISDTWGKGIPSIESLANFAKHCPKLKNLEYPVQLNFDSPPSLPSPTLSAHPLQNFRCILYDDVQDPVVIALHLYQIFPGLKWADGPGKRWDEVQKVLNAFIFLSEQGRHPSLT